MTSLNLFRNCLGDGGGRALAESLSKNTTLTSLDLGGNGLGEGAGRALAETLRFNTVLTSLAVSWNGFNYANYSDEDEVGFLTTGPA